MQEISAYELIKEKLHAIPNLRHKGSLFEKISKQFLQEHDSANEYESIDLWYDWELRGKERDKGIDIVITTSNKEYIAVQCKFHQNSVSYNDISTFLNQLLIGHKLQNGVGEVKFKKGIIISTSNLTSEALKAIEKIRSTGMGIDIDEITEEDFIYSRIDWEKFDPTKTEDEIPLCDKKRPRPHQTEAIEKTKKYFSDPKNARGKLIMACGTGKTYTSLKIMETLDPKITLFLAPSIALLSQTFREYAQEKSEPFYASIVCSDDKTGQSKKNKSKNEDNDDIKFSELPIKPSTRLEDILSAYEKAQKENKRFIIFSTYQSALRIKEAQEAGLNGIDLIICDEAHRTVGAMYSTNERDDKNAFTLCHSDGNVKATKRLYMTATPKVYSESSKAKAKESDNVIYSMDDAEVFGEEIYTLNFERAIGLDLLRGKIFDSGSRATVAVIFFVKDKSVQNSTIHYYEVEDYLKREAKLNLLANFENLDSVPFKEITPNDKGDWINQRNDDFEKLIPLKRDKQLKIFNTIFDLNSNGVASGRDPWVYNFSPNALKQSVQTCIDTYNADLKRFNERFREAFKQRTAKDKGIKPAELYKHLNDREITTDKTKIAWTDGLKNKLIKNENLPESGMERVRLALYRPFNKQWLYWDKDLIHRQRRFSKIFPDKSVRNVVINTTTRNFCSLIGDAIPDTHFIGDANAYPLYYYDDLGNRYNAISGYALNLFRRHYKDNAIVEEEIFYYIYAIFHHKGYLEKYKNSLAKEAPRIALSEDFKELSMLGKELAELHLNYESGEMHDSVKHNLLENAGMEGYYDVVQMKKDKKGDRIQYNHHITITQIPKKAFDYVVNGKSAIDWVIERYSITTDKDSLIENNPNHYAGGQYVFELLCRVITLSVKSVDLIEKISEKRFE
ncbi:type III restriction enzyme, res subunit [Helicobacter pylori GAM71Ai]|uniref:type ISP restriction/modification enzyme n=1 Tax=Helicobacter pylori TaxID=210 RepID=UPI0002B97B02|nr:type ISP restriction/modification enzyme [Helicobacter pylori]EMH36892.1 type III restriction enzyme, res subunit [Helicobacter pylori GAM71Ai]